MREQLKALREKMKEKGIDIYVIPTNDYHGSEYMTTSSAGNSSPGSQDRREH